MSDEKFDAIIVGGGPAGVITAYTLAYHGKSVVLLDKKKHDQIGNKTCGDALDESSPIFLFESMNLPMPFGEEVSDDLNLLTVASMSSRLSIPAPGYTVDRHKYGQRLLKECIDIGVRVIDSAPVRDVIIDNGYVVGVKYKNGSDLVSIFGKVVVDCSGTWAAVRKLLPEGFSEGLYAKLDDHHIAASYREIISLKEEHPFRHEIVLEYDKDIPSPGYIWYFTKGEKALNVGTGWLKSDPVGNGKGMKEVFHDALHKTYSPESYTVDVSGGGQIPIRPPFDCMTFNGGVVVGDAGCLVDPTTAEGHGPALVGGYYAGLVLNEALDKGDVSREGLWEYNRLIMAHYGVRNSMSYVVLKYLRILGPEKIDEILKKKFLTEEELTKIFLGEPLNLSVVEIIKKLLRILPDFKVPIILNRLLKEIEVVRDHYKTYPDEHSELADWRKKRDKLIGEKL